MKRKANAKKLFDIGKKQESDIKQETVETTKRKGRPTKVKQEPIKETTKKRGRPPKVKEEKIQKTVKQETPKTEPKKKDINVIKPEKGWKDFNKGKPEALVPCEFCINTGKDKNITFRGYRTLDGCTCTNDPYKLTVLRKKYNNLYYKEIQGCIDVRDCPRSFPNCEECQKVKKK